MVTVLYPKVAQLFANTAYKDGTLFSERYYISKIKIDLSQQTIILKGIAFENKTDVSFQLQILLSERAILRTWSLQIDIPTVYIKNMFISPYFN